MTRLLALALLALLAALLLARRKPAPLPGRWQEEDGVQPWDSYAAALSRR